MTGTNKGLGHDLVKLFLTHHHDYVIFATSRQPIAQAQDQWKNIDARQQVKCLNLDVRSPQSIAELVKQVAQRSIKLDLLVNNAGVFNQKSDKKEFPRVPEATADL